MAVDPGVDDTLSLLVRASAQLENVALDLDPYATARCRLRASCGSCARREESDSDSRASRTTSAPTMSASTARAPSGAGPVVAGSTASTSSWSSSARRLRASRSSSSSSAPGPASIESSRSAASVFRVTSFDSGERDHATTRTSKPTTGFQSGAIVRSCESSQSRSRRSHSPGPPHRRRLRPGCAASSCAGRSRPSAWSGALRRARGRRRSRVFQVRKRGRPHHHQSKRRLPADAAAREIRRHDGQAHHRLRPDAAERPRPARAGGACRLQARHRHPLIALASH